MAQSNGGVLEPGKGTAPGEIPSPGCRSRLHSTYGVTASLLVGAFALTAIIGWHLKIQALVQILPEFAPMQYTTAISFLMCAVSLLLLHRGHGKLAIVALLPALTLASLSAAENLLGQEILGIDHLVTAPFVDTRSPAPGRMSLLTAITFVICCAALVSSALHRANRNTSWITAILSSIAISTSLIGVIGYSIDITGAYSWLHIAQMSLPSVTSFLLLSAGIQLCAWHDHFITGLYSPRWLATIVLCASLNSTFLVGSALQNQEALNRQRSAYSKALVIKTALESELQDRHHSIRRMARRCAEEPTFTLEYWLRDAREYLADDSGYHAIVRTDRNLQVLWSTTTGKPPVTGLPVDAQSAEPLLAKLSRHGDVTTTSSSDRPGEISIVAAIRNGQEFAGCIAASIETTQFFKLILPKGFAGSHRFTITADGKQVFQQGLLTPRTDPLSSTLSFLLHGTEWTVTHWPDPVTVHSEHTRYSKLILGMGILVSVLLAMTSRLFQIAASRSRDVSMRNARLQREIEQRVHSQEKLAQTLTELRETHDKLMTASIQIGRAEVATNILHNVGNVLNSINITSTMLNDKIRQSRITSVTKTADLLESHQQDLPAFFTTDRRGRELPGFIRKLANQLHQEQHACSDDLHSLVRDVNHLRDIISMQQRHSKTTNIEETLSVAELVEMSLKMHSTELRKSHISIEIDIDPLLVIHAERHKVLQILINLLSNAKHACLAGKPQEPVIRIRAHSHESTCEISIIDNGEGIPPQNLASIFTHGFTTKKDGHGFGLHSCAIVAKEMNGELRATSEGTGRGATFTLTLPLHPPSNNNS